jgi:Domain of unknown function (DUF4340)
VQKRLRTTLYLFVVVSILTAFLIFSDRQGTDDDTILLSTIDASSIDHITVQRLDNEDIVFQKQDGRWFMTSPVKARANMARINAILHLLRSRSFVQIDTEDISLKPYQLDPAAITLYLGKHEFVFGATDPLDDRRYLMFNNTIHLLNDSLFHQLRQAPMFFISTRLVPDEETIDSIQFSEHLVSKIGQRWSLSPENDAVSAEQLDALVATWQTGEARQVQQYSAADVTEKIVVKFKSGRTALFDVVSKEQILVLGRSDLALQYHLSKAIADILFVPQKNTNEKK